MHASTAILAALCSLVYALPTSDIIPRAGGPAIVDIPPTCTVTNPLPTASVANYQPGPAAMNDILYYAYYSSSPDADKVALAEQCLKQCYGYGEHVECKGAYWAENLPVPKGYYGSPGGQLETGCLMFKRALQSGDFVVAPAGDATNAFAGNIAC